MDILKNVSKQHEKLKKSIHNTRIPLGRRGRFIMGCIYLTAPIFGGYYIMEWALSKRDINIGKNVNKMKNSIIIFVEIYIFIFYLGRIS